MQPVCVVASAQDGPFVRKDPVVKDVKHAMLLGEAYVRVVFGDEALAKYQPLRRIAESARAVARFGWWLG